MDKKRIPYTEKWAELKIATVNLTNRFNPICSRLVECPCQSLCRLFNLNAKSHRCSQFLFIHGRVNISQTFTTNVIGCCLPRRMIDSSYQQIDFVLLLP